MNNQYSEKISSLYPYSHGKSFYNIDVSPRSNLMDIPIRVGLFNITPGNDYKLSFLIVDKNGSTFHSATFDINISNDFIDGDNSSTSMDGDFYIQSILIPNDRKDKDTFKIIAQLFPTKIRESDNDSFIPSRAETFIQLNIKTFMH